MKQANVSDLKAHLSAYLAQVREGEVVIVLDRKTPIARLVPYDEYTEDVQVHEPTRPKSELRKIRGVRPRRAVDVVKVLREGRDQR